MDTQDRHVTITDIDIPFWRLVAIFIKFALAAIPAYIVVALIVFVVIALLGVVFGGFGMMMMGAPDFN
jgi:hypothetical protein